MKRGRRSVDFKKQIYEVAKEKNPELEITVESIEMMNEMINNVLHKIVDEAAKNAAAASSNSNQKILINKDIWGGVKQLFPPDLARYANLHGYVACTTFETNVAHDRAVNDRESQQLAHYFGQVKI